MKPLEIDKRIYFTLVISWYIHIKWYIQSYPEIKFMSNVYQFLPVRKHIDKNVSSLYGLNLLGCIKWSTADTIKTASKRTIQKTAETKGNLIGNKIAYRVIKDDS